MEWLIGLALLAIIDYFNDRELPDVLVYLYFAYGFLKSILMGNFVLFIIVFLILYILVKIGVFGSAEAFIFPVLAIHGLKELIIAVILSILLANIYLIIIQWNRLKYRWLLLGLMFVWWPIIPLLSFSLFLFLNITNMVRYKIVKREKALDEFSPEFGHISNISKIPKKIRIRASIPYLPFLFLGYLIEFSYFVTRGDFVN